MPLGLLWFDDDPDRPLADKITRATQHFHSKHNIWPTVCYVHPSQLPEVTTISLIIQDRSPEIQLSPSNNILPHHLWLGSG